MAKDRFHDAVRNALEKQEWTITADPYEVSFHAVGNELLPVGCAGGSATRTN